MPRKPRIEYAGAVYHVISRGNRREAIVRDDADRMRFVDTMGEACERMGWRLHAWVLMSNHYHWLLETPEANLVRGMQWFQTTWSTRFRVRHGLSGHVLQGRYKAHLIDPQSETYFQSVSSYIHLNPVRAEGLLSPRHSLASYRWSSYPSYLKPPGRRPDWLAVEWVLGNLGLNDSPAGRKAYREHMQEYVAELRGQRGAEASDAIEEEWEELRSDWCLGDDAFRERMLDQVVEVIEGKDPSGYDGAALKAQGERHAEALLASALHAFGLVVEDLEGMKKTDGRKQVIAWLIRRETSVRNRWVSQRLNMGHEVNVSQSVRRVFDATSGDLWRLKTQMLKTLKSKD